MIWMAMMGEESKLEKYFVEEAVKLGALVRKLQWVHRRGAPDRLVIHNGNVMFLEFKAPGEKLRGDQKREHEKLKDAKANVMTIDSMQTAQDLLALMEAHGEATT